MIKYYKNSKFIVFALLLTTFLTLGHVQGMLLLQTGQYVFIGDEADISLGFAVTGVGDVNNDGYDDYAMSAPNKHLFGMTYNGAVYLFFGEEDNNMLDLTIEDADVVFYGGSNEYAGTTLTSAGDVNGDGYDDFLIGSPFYGSASLGIVYLIVGRTTAAWNTGYDLALNSISFYGDKDGDKLGAVTSDNVVSVSGIGDIDNDGFDDIAFGSILHDINSSISNHGKLYIYYGSSSINGNMNVSTADLILHGANPYDLLGSVAGLGDVNGDGIDDYAVGGYGYDATELNDITGAIYLMYGGSTRLSGTHNVSEVVNGALILGEVAGSYFGAGIFPIGDINGDGKADFAVGAPHYKAYTGSLYVFFGGDYSGLVNAVDADKKFYGIDGENDLFGMKAAGIADINGDGMSELAVSEYPYDGSFNNQGRVHIYLGSTDTGVYYPSDADMQIGWESPNSKYLGSSMANAGDVNGDEVDDFIIGIYGYSNDTHYNLGAVILLTKIFDNQKFTETETMTTIEIVTETVTEEGSGFLSDLPISPNSVIAGLFIVVAVYRGNTRRNRK